MYMTGYTSKYEYRTRDGTIGDCVVMKYAFYTIIL